MRLHGRSALVTGGSSGIGAAVAEALATAGCRVVLLGRDSARLDAVAARIGARAVPADLGTRGGLERACEAADGTDLLVNAAGRGWAGELVAMPIDVLTELVELNLTVPLRLARAALPAMCRRGSGHLVFVSSIAAVGVGRESVYSATKAGLRAFAAAIRYEVGRAGVGVTTVLPGAVDTPFFERRGEPYDRGFPRMIGAGAVAARTVRAVQQDRAEVFAPRWLAAAARMNGAVPETFHRLADRFG